MKHPYPFYLLILALLAACANQGPFFSIANPLATTWQDAPATFSRAAVARLLGPIGPNQVVVARIGGKVVPCQWDDLDGDGQWDELALLVDLPAKKKVAVALRVTNRSEAPVFAPRTQVRMAVRNEDGSYTAVSKANRISGTATEVTTRAFQMEGPGWENDWAAYRNYLDERNGFDIFGKLVAALVLDSVGIKGNYHEMLPWGMDILKVGNSLGAGGIGLLINDSVYRVTAPSGGAFQLICSGPVRSVFDLTFDSVSTASGAFQVKHRITIWAGEPGYEAAVFVAPAGKAGLLTGLVNIAATAMHPVEANGAQGIYTLDPQAFLGEGLGMGVVTESRAAGKPFTLPDTGPGVIQTFALPIQMDKEGFARFFFFCAWEKRAPELMEPEKFQRWAREAAEKWAAQQRLIFQ